MTPPPSSTAAPQAPAVGPWRRLLGPFYFTGSFWYRFHLFGVRVLPNFLMPVMTWCVASLFYLALGSVRRAVGRNLDVVLGPCGFWERQRRAHRLIVTFAHCLNERYEQFVPNRSFECIPEGKEHWDAMLATKKGFILATAHIGNWELASRLPVLQSECTVHVVREEEIDPAAQEFIRELLASHGGTGYVTHFAEDDFGLGVRLMSAIRKGELVALQCDRPRSGGQSIRARMFGRELDLPVGPAAIARSTQAPLLPVFVNRIGRRRYRVDVRPPIHVERTSDRHADHRRAVEALAAEIESAIRREPYQWFCFADVWS